MIVLNFKNYPESSGENATHLLNEITALGSENAEILKYVSVAPSMIDLLSLKAKFQTINIISQNVDNLEQANTTGWVGIEQLKSNNIKFSLYNHSEHRVWNDSIVENIKSIQVNGINLIVCCENLDEAQTLLQANPFGIAYEPKDLIGSDTSVTTRPEVIRDFLDLVKEKTTAFIGAGIKQKSDIEKGLELGAEGFIISSSFVKSTDPKKLLSDLTSPFLNLNQKFFE